MVIEVDGHVDIDVLVLVVVGVDGFCSFPHLVRSQAQIIQSSIFESLNKITVHLLPQTLTSAPE